MNHFEVNVWISEVKFKKSNKKYVNDLSFIQYLEGFNTHSHILSRANGSKDTYRQMGGRLGVAPPARLPSGCFQERQTIPVQQEGPCVHLATSTQVSHTWK